MAFTANGSTATLGSHVLGRIRSIDLDYGSSEIDVTGLETDRKEYEAGLDDIACEIEVFGANTAVDRGDIGDLGVTPQGASEIEIDDCVVVGKQFLPMTVDGELATRFRIRPTVPAAPPPP